MPPESRSEHNTPKPPVPPDLCYTPPHETNPPKRGGAGVGPLHFALYLFTLLKVNEKVSHLPFCFSSILETISSGDFQVITVF
jgi:hypothetical protein